MNIMPATPKKQYYEGCIDAPQDVMRRAEGDCGEYENEDDSDNDEGFVDIKTVDIVYEICFCHYSY
jgi:hypothetical protein